MPKVLILGSTGMIGSAVERHLRFADFELSLASRTQDIKFDALRDSISHLFSSAKLSSGDFIINCVGLTKGRILDTSSESRSHAVRLNYGFPHRLITAAEAAGVRVIQVATDCVFSGSRGGYNEKDPHDPCDVYGKTKSLGEIPSPAAMHLRCSIIGPELGRGSLFFEWARKQPIGARVPGFVDHFWNGLSSTTFGLIVAGILKFDSFRPGVHHLVPRDYVTKDQLVRLVFKHLGRVDVEVIATETEFPTNRILSTQYEDENSSFFEAAGYSESPTIAQMVEEMCSELPN